MKTLRLPFTVAAMFLATMPAFGSVLFNPTFDTSITSNSNAAAIEGAIDTALGNIEGLFTNSVTIPVTFYYSPEGTGSYLLQTGQTYYSLSYSTYVGDLESDSTANPSNTNLSTALANLSSGNDSNGADAMALTAADYNMLTGSSVAGDISITINSSDGFSFSEPTSSGQYDLIGGLEHELDETMGGGGGGSTLNSVESTCPGDPTGFFCNKYGATDLLRYSAAGTPSFATSGSATSYLSIDGGATSVVAFNQNSGGDYGDFGPPCGPSAGNVANDQYIQNAFNCTGQDEAYTTSSPEFTMLEAIGWDGTTSSPTPEPATVALVGAGILGLAYLGRRRRKVRE